MISICIMEDSWLVSLGHSGLNTADIYFQVKKVFQEQYTTLQPAYQKWQSRLASKCYSAVRMWVSFFKKKQTNKTILSVEIQSQRLLAENTTVSDKLITPTAAQVNTELRCPLQKHIFLSDTIQRLWFKANCRVRTFLVHNSDPGLMTAWYTAATSSFETFRRLSERCQ